MLSNEIKFEIEIKNITSTKLQQLAGEIDSSCLGNKNGKIDNGEFEIFKQSAQTYVLKDIVPLKDYREIFGFETSGEQQVNTDSLAYVQAKKDIEQADIEAQKKKQAEDKKNIKIVELKHDIVRIRQELYKGKYDELKTGTKLTSDQTIMSFISGSLPANLGLGYGVLGWISGEGASFLVAPTLIGLGAGLLTVGLVAGGCYLCNKYKSSKDIKYMQECEQENPQLYSALKYAEAKLAELEASK